MRPKSGLKPPTRVPSALLSGVGRTLTETSQSDLNARSVRDGQMGPPPPSAIKHKPSGCELRPGTGQDVPQDRKTNAARQYPNRPPNERLSPSAQVKLSLRRGRICPRLDLPDLESTATATPPTNLRAALVAAFALRIEVLACDRLRGNKLPLSKRQWNPRRRQKLELWERVKVRLLFLLLHQVATTLHYGKQEHTEICASTISRATTGFNTLGRTPTAVGVEEAHYRSRNCSFASLLLCAKESRQQARTPGIFL
jgi:hypothetical protein